MPPRVAHFPSLRSLSANPYWLLLGEGLRRQGWVVDDDAAPLFGARWLRANRGCVDVLHFHYVQQLYGYETIHARLRWVLRLARNFLLARLWGYRTVFTLHDLTPSYALKPGWVDYLGYLAAVHLCHSVIVHCEVARSAVHRRFGRRRGVYIVNHPHYADIYPNTISHAEARQRLGLAPDSLVYLFFGGLRPNKGLNALCDAFAQLDDPSARLLIAGAPSHDKGHMAALRHAASQDARIALREGFVPNEDVQVYMNAADVVVLPFAQILTSSSATLALSLGKPVVAPAMGCLPELISQDAGELYDPAQADGLLHALERIRARDLAAMGLHAAESVRSFTVARFVEDTLRAYEGAR